MTSQPGPSTTGHVSTIHRAFDPGDAGGVWKFWMTCTCGKEGEKHLRSKLAERDAARHIAESQA
jgi:hypothetical protein